MRELQAIVETYKQIKDSEHRVALATVVKVSGSTYRRPGARMLITQDGDSVGTISGGCLEHDVIVRSQQVITTGNAVIVKYDTTFDEDIIWGLGLGCNGIVYILIECVELNHELNHLAFIAQCLDQQQVGVLATIFSVAGRATLEVGGHLMLYPNHTTSSDIEDNNLLQIVLADARVAYADQQSISKSYSVAGSVIEIFINVIQPPVPLVIFGAGHDVSPIVQFAKALGWRVTVVDPRCSTASLTRFQTADRVLPIRLETVSKEVDLDLQTIALVMTHNYLYDSKLLQLLLPSPVRYVGVLGPKHRTDRLLQELREGRIYSEAQLERLYSPVGIDIGADTPEEIALSIVSEIQAVLANRSGGFLKDRQAPIHDRSEPVPPHSTVSKLPIDVC